MTIYVAVVYLFLPAACCSCSAKMKVGDAAAVMQPALNWASVNPVLTWSPASAVLRPKFGVHGYFVLDASSWIDAVHIQLDAALRSTNDYL
jgi:hypothetical protein